MKRFISAFVLLSLLTAPVMPVSANPPNDVASREITPIYYDRYGNIGSLGGKLGVAISGPLYRGKLPYYKIENIDPKSNFYSLHVGDFLFDINTYNFSSADDVVKFVNGFNPGDSVTITYLDSTKNLAPYYQRAALIGDYVHNTDGGIGSSYSPSYSDGASQIYQEKALDSSLDKIVQSDSKGWWMNSYDNGSMHGSHITYQSGDGSTLLVEGKYTYNSGNTGSVMAKIMNGKLICVEYWDSWFGCREKYETDAGTKYAAIIVTGLVLAALASSGSSNSSGSTNTNRSTSTSSSSSASSSSWADFQQRRREDEQARAQDKAEKPRSKSSQSKPDTSIGCAWGDRAYGTCH